MHPDCTHLPVFPCLPSLPHKLCQKGKSKSTLCCLHTHWKMVRFLVAGHPRENESFSACVWAWNHQLRRESFVVAGEGHGQFSSTSINTASDVTDRLWTFVGFGHRHYWPSHGPDSCIRWLHLPLTSGCPPKAAKPEDITKSSASSLVGLQGGPIQKGNLFRLRPPSLPRTRGFHCLEAVLGSKSVSA